MGRLITTQEDIPGDQWASVLASFSRQYRGWPIFVELLYRENESQPVAQNLPLMGIDYEAGEGLRIMLGEQPGSHVAHVVPDPVGLAVRINEDGSYEGLQIQARDGTTTVLRFTEPVRPETMDGVGPWSRRP